MKILDIKVQDNLIIINTDNNSEVNKICIDNLYNNSNKYSQLDEEHTYVITDFSIVGDNIQFSTDQFDSFDASAFTIYINNKTIGFYFDKQELYYKEVDLLTTYCSTCLDKEQKERIVLFMLKQQLLEYAVANNLIEDQISYYIDLARMLNIDLKFGSQAITPSKKGCKCCNGICSLC